MKNEFKGTKGKWELSKPFDGVVLMNGNVKAQVLEYSAKKGFQEEDKANAQLISKAPEILEMLIDITTHPNSISNDCGEGVIIDFEDFNKIIQLIKEATTI